VLFVWYLWRHFPGYNVSRLARQQTRIVIAGLISVGAAMLANLVWPSTDLTGAALIAPLAIKIGVALIVYGIASWFLARPELADVARVTKALFRRQRPTIQPS